MRRLIIQRLLALVPILFGFTFLSFALMHLAGGDAVLARVDTSGCSCLRKRSPLSARGWGWISRFWCSI